MQLLLALPPAAVNDVNLLPACTMVYDMKSLFNAAAAAAGASKEKKKMTESQADAC